MLRKTLSIVAIIAMPLLFVNQAFGKFIPDDQIKNPHQVFSAEDANMTKAEFMAVIDKADSIYGPIISDHGGKLDIKRLWDDDTLNASAMQWFGTWTVNMYGGLARHPEMTLDGFAMVLCHELGHHLAGFSFKKGGFSFGGVWAANEGQSDYFAAHVCSRRMWQDEIATNATFRATVKPNIQASCDAAWTTTEDQDLCYRVNAGGESLARVLAALAEDVEPSYETPDTNKVNATDSNHPKAQCRLDTTYHASLCTADFDDSVIPGKEKSDPFGKDAEREASKYSCMEISNFVEGLRPRCWFKPGV